MRGTIRTQRWVLAYQRGTPAADCRQNGMLTAVLLNADTPGDANWVRLKMQIYGDGMRLWA